jgi:hypothetical protein
MAAFLTLAALTVRAADTRSEYLVRAYEGENYRWAAFRLWAPEEVETVRGVLVLVPGLNRDGRDLVDEPLWRDFAREQRLALLGTYIQGRQGRVYYLARNGTGYALTFALDQLAVRAGRPEVADAPLLMWGHVVGGQFAHSMACYAPERVLAFAAVKGQNFRSIPQQATWSVPGVAISGERDALKRNQGMYNLLYRNRPDGALWCAAVEQEATDEIGNHALLVLPFFRSVLEMRMPKSDGAVRYADLKPLREEDGLLGDIPSLAVAPPSRFLYDEDRAVWLPDAEVARAWQDFMRGGYPTPQRGIRETYLR